VADDLNPDVEPDGMPDGTPQDAPDADIDASLLDDASFDAVRASLGALAFLDPQQAAADVPMPADVWDRLRSALDAEATARAVDAHENVVALPGATVPAVATVAASPGHPVHRASRGRRWAGGLVAASVAVVAVGLAVGTMRGGSGDASVVAVSAPSSTAPAPASGIEAGGSVSDDAAARADASGAPEAGGAPEAFSVDPTDRADAVTAQAPEASIVPAARMVKTSQTNYVPGELRSQVVSLVKNAGFATPQEAMAKTVPLAAMPVGDGFTASWQALRDCVTWLTQSPDAQALIVDRATYDGNAAGVIVAPATLPDADLSTPSPTVTVDTGQGVFDVWVVNPECKQKWNSLDDFPLYAWGQ